MCDLTKQKGLNVFIRKDLFTIFKPYWFMKSYYKEAA